jgi:hypothetical protein
VTGRFSGLPTPAKASRVYGATPGEYPMGRFTTAEFTKRKPGIKARTVKKRLSKAGREELQKKPLRRNQYRISTILKQLRALDSVKDHNR